MTFFKTMTTVTGSFGALWPSGRVSTLKEGSFRLNQQLGRGKDCKMGQIVSLFDT